MPCFGALQVAFAFLMLGLVAIAFWRTVKKCAQSKGMYSVGPGKFLRNGERGFSKCPVLYVAVSCLGVERVKHAGASANPPPP